MQLPSLGFFAIVSHLASPYNDVCLREVIAMQRRLKSFAILLLFASLAFAADVPWKGKPYEQWNDKDLERIFRDSPWARMSTITRTWNSASASTATPGTGNNPRQTAGDTGPLTRGGPQTGSPNAPGADDLNFYVHWASSRVMRAASARRAFLHGGKPDLDVAKYANEPQEEYQIAVQSEDMSPFARHDEKFYQENSYLEPKKSKLKIAPSHVRYERDDRGTGVATAIFFFPKKTESGDPTISTEEKNVDFLTKIEGATLRVTFEPVRMVDNQGPAL